jgi:hypothetical protein
MPDPSNGEPSAMSNPSNALGEPAGDYPQLPARPRTRTVTSVPASTEKSSSKGTSVPEMDAEKSSPKGTSSVPRKPQISAGFTSEVSSIGYNISIDSTGALGASLGGHGRAFDRRVRTLPYGTLLRRCSGEHANWRSMKDRVWKSQGRYTLHPDFEDFRDFLAHMGRKGEASRTLDRIDPNDPEYGPGKVRWATKREQANNRTNTITLRGRDGRILPLTEWAKITGQKPNTMRKRYHRGGWTEEEIVANEKPLKGSLAIVLPARPGQPSQDVAGALQPPAMAVQEGEVVIAPASSSVQPAANTDIWVAAWRETFPGVPVGLLRDAEHAQLAQARRDYESMSNNDWSDFLDWSVRNWRHVIQAEFGWVRKWCPPKFPSARFFRQNLVKFGNSYATHLERERLHSLKGDEFIYATALAIGKTPIQAAEKAAAYRARRAAEHRQLQVSIRSQQQTAREHDEARAHLEHARGPDSAVPSIRPKPFMKAERSNEEVLAMMQAAARHVPDWVDETPPAPEKAPDEVPNAAMPVMPDEEAVRPVGDKLARMQQLGDVIDLSAARAARAAA